MKKKLMLVCTTMLAVMMLMSACASNGGETEGQTNEGQNAGDERKAAKKGNTTYPIEVIIRDFEGNQHTQTFEKAPERIITNNLSSIEILMHLGLKVKIVGTTNPDNAVTGPFVDEIAGLNMLGDKMTVSKETIVGQTPDLVVGRSMMFDDEFMGSVSTLNEFNINVFTQSASDMDGYPPLTSIIDDILTLGEILDVNDRAAEFAKELEDRYTAIIEKVNEKKGDKELVIMPIVGYDSADSTFSIFDVTAGLQRDLLAKLNLVPAIDNSGADPSLETIIQTNPDVIVYVKADRNASLDVNAVDSIMNDPLLKDVSAIKEGRVYTTTYDDFMDYGVRIFDTFEMLGNTIYGE